MGDPLFFLPGGGFSIGEKTLELTVLSSLFVLLYYVMHILARIRPVCMYIRCYMQESVVYNAFVLTCRFAEASNTNPLNGLHDIQLQGEKKKKKNYITSVSLV